MRSPAPPPPVGVAPFSLAAATTSQPTAPPAPEEGTVKISLTWCFEIVCFLINIMWYNENVLDPGFG